MPGNDESSDEDLNALQPLPEAATLPADTTVGYAFNTTPAVTGNSSSARASDTRDTYKISVKLDGDNYVYWVMAMQAMLNLHGLWHVVVPTSNPQAAPTDAEKNKVMHAIIRNIQIEQLALISGCGMDPKDAWETLQGEYAGNSQQSIATLMVQLNTLKLVGPATLASARKFFARMNLLEQQLAKADPARKLPAADFATKCVLGLPADLEPIIHARLTGPTDKLTMKNVREDTIAYLKRRENTSPDPAQPAAVAMATATPAEFQGTCWNCGISGHRRAQCTKPRNNLTRPGGLDHRRQQSRGRSTRRQRHGQRAFVAMVSTSGTAMSGTSKALHDTQRDWIVDGAASCGHVTKHRDVLSNYRAVQDKERSTIIPYASDSPVIVEGYGDVKLTLADGSSIELRKVGFAPKGSGNLFSIRAAIKTLAKAGTTAAHLTTLRSTKLIDTSTNMTLATSTERGGLYYLDLAKEQDFPLGA